MSGATVLIFHPTPARKDFLREVSEAAGVSMGEVLRRMIDRCRADGMGHLFPHISGREWRH